jgi:hypothetical protein
VGDPIGSIHEPDWEVCLRPRPCPNATCGCHIGYVYLQRLRQASVYGPGILERIPLEWKRRVAPDATGESDPVNRRASPS